MDSVVYTLSIGVLACQINRIDYSKVFEMSSWGCWSCDNGGRFVFIKLNIVNWLFSVAKV